VVLFVGLMMLGVAVSVLLSPLVVSAVVVAVWWSLQVVLCVSSVT